MTLRNALAIAVLAIGSLQILGSLCGSRALRGLGLASGISPYTRVFCEADGYEAFAARFELSGCRPDGAAWSCPLDAERYAGLAGPYNRRNVYGAALAFAPRLPAALRDSLITPALAPGSSLRRELDIPDEVDDLQVTIVPRDGERHGPWSYPDLP